MKIIIEKRESFANGHEFPITGAYEKLVGKVYGEVDPDNRLNKVIVNLDKAPRNGKGKVEYTSDIYILKPIDMKRGNGKIFYDAPNRGSKRIVMFLNDAAAANDPSTVQDAGNGFLMREGYTIVWSGWQGDLLGGENSLVLRVPTATDNGKEIVRKTRTEIVVTQENIYSQFLSGDGRIISYETASTDKNQALLTVRAKSYGARTPVTNSDWEFASCKKNKETGKLDIVPSTKELCLLAGYKPGYIYEFIYLAKDPLVLGLGFAAVRDLISFLRYDTQDEAGNPNPLGATNGRTGIKKAYAWGRSQSGRFLRDMIYHGFNEDESNRQVFAAISPHVAGGGRIFLNYEFARPVSSSQQHSDQLDPELFPFAYSVLKDPQTGREDGILKRPKTDPYIVHTQTSTEYWQKRASLSHTDGKGKDVPIPNRARIYFIAGAQHNTPFGSQPRKGSCRQLTNPMPIGDALRALIVAMDRWVSQGVLPPPNQIPTVADGTLVSADQESTGFPRIPTVRYAGLFNRQLFLDYGPDLIHGRIDIHPPKPVKDASYKVLVPKVDSDGNDVGGIRLPSIRVPVATYTGWNLQRKGLAEDELCGLLGSYIPFAKTKEERAKNGDPRLCIEERYRDQADYVSRVGVEARWMVEQRWLLPEDAQRIIEEAEKLPLFDAKKP
ncbi:MAG: alpha/beta hydrolase domain-containing protein [Candidatus Binatia bacterium]